MSKDTPRHSRNWDGAARRRPTATPEDRSPLGAIVPDGQRDDDQIAVVYDKGQKPPEITIRTTGGSVHTVLADGVAVAVVARAGGRAPRSDEVLLVERST